MENTTKLDKDKKKFSIVEKASDLFRRYSMIIILKQGNMSLNMKLFK